MDFEQAANEFRRALLDAGPMVAPLYEWAAGVRAHFEREGYTRTRRGR